MNFLQIRIADIPPPCRAYYLNPELQTREDITVYLVHAYMAELVAFPRKDNITSQSCSRFHAKILGYWPKVGQRHRFIAIVNALQRAKNQAYKQDEEFICWLKEQEEFKLPA